jgi:hypothetical protein
MNTLLPTSLLKKPLIASRLAVFGIIKFYGGVYPNADWASCLKYSQTA